MKKPDIFNGIFFFLYIIIHFFIFVGEITQKIFLLPFFLLLKIASLLKKIIIPKLSSLFSFFYKIKEKITIKVTAKISREKIKLPKLNLYIFKAPFFLFKFCHRFFKKRLLVKIRYFILGILTTLVFIVFYQSYVFVKQLPSPKSIGKVNYALSSYIYDRNGKILYEIYREKSRTPIYLKDLPSYVIFATIAIEDKDFYRHKGVALYSGILRAIRDTFRYKELQGGSTITQQLVKASLLTNERTFTRKIKEIILALWTERVYNKDQILEMYFNQVPYGGPAYGIEEAAKRYFEKSAKDLTLEEAAFLAGLPQAPSLYSPYLNPELAKKRRNEVLKAMWQQNYIDEKTYQVAIKKELKVAAPTTKIKAPHFVFYVKNQLEEKYGLSQVEEGGLRVITSLDLNIQEKAEEILREELDKIRQLNVGNGAILVTRPSTGEILAMVGSYDYFALPHGAFNVTTALRQPGSAIKPIMYSLALQRGYTAATIIDDSPVIFNIPGSPPYRPVNYDGRFHGKIPLRYALANSYNVPAIKVLSNLGIEDFINFATKMGISTWKDKSRYGLSITLGGGEVTMLDMAKAFGVLANGGYKVNLLPIIKVNDYLGKTISEFYPFKIREIDSGIAYIISDILADNIARRWAFGTNSALEISGYKVAVKTGTTDDKKDNWTIGYTPEFLVAVWVGNNDNSPMNPYLTSGITGAAPIWNRVMNYLLKNYSSGKWYEKPENVVEKNCYFGRKEYFIAGTENKVNCSQTFFTSPTLTP